MKVLLLVGGVLFLLLALLLLVSAALVFFIARSRRARTAPAVTPQQRAAASRPIPTPAPPPADATVVLDTRAIRTFGALHGVSGALAGRHFPITAEGFYIGRDRKHAQVVIDNPSVSKRHVWIGVRQEAVVAIDQQSTNGTYLNRTATRISEARLTPGDTLIISDDVARLEYRA